MELFIRRPKDPTSDKPDLLTVQDKGFETAFGMIPPDGRGMLLKRLPQLVYKFSPDGLSFSVSDQHTNELIGYISLEVEGEHVLLDDGGPWILLIASIREAKIIDPAQVN